MRHAHLIQKYRAMKRFTKVIALGSVTAALVGCGEVEPTPFSAVKAQVYCKDQIKSLLRDPDSYKFKSVEILTKNGEFGTANIYYRARNGFNGYTSGSAHCEIYDKDGETWTKARIN